MSPRRRRPVRTALMAVPADPDAVTPATRHETMPVGLLAVVAGFFALAFSARLGDMMLYGDAVAHLGIARRILDTRNPGLMNWGGVWLPLPHLLMLPFIGRMAWWQNGMAGAWPSLICYILGSIGMFRLARRVLPPRWALIPTAFFALNANLLYLSTTAMTEPLFLALLVWIVLLTMELVDAIKAEQFSRTATRLVLLGLLNLAAVMTRYDGWVLAAAVWLIAAWQLFRKPAVLRRVWPSMLGFTLFTVAGPLAWFWYNHVFGHDWLDFMRGPYSAKEIDRKTSPPGSHKYWGWHNPAWSLMLYARTAQVDAAWWETGWLVAAAALWGTWKATRQKLNGAAYLLWLPLPFYVYSISYGSVPIFIPQLYPHSFYNSRYGIEMLPVLAIFASYALWAGVQQFSTSANPALQKAQPLLVRLAPPVALMMVVVNLLLMLHATPLVLKEAMVNSRGRLALEEPLARQLQTFPVGSMILMQNSDHVGALQMAGIPLRQTIGPDDYYLWRDGLASPARVADYVVAIGDGDLLAAARAHPEGLTELSILCTSGQPCVRIYESSLHQKGTP